MHSWPDVRPTRCCSRLGCNRYYDKTSKSYCCSRCARGEGSHARRCRRYQKLQKRFLQHAVRAGITTCCSACLPGHHVHTRRCHRVHRNSTTRSMEMPTSSMSGPMPRPSVMQTQSELRTNSMTQVSTKGTAVTLAEGVDGVQPR